METLVKNTQALFMPSAIPSMLLLMQDSQRTEIQMPWHIPTGLIWGMRDICPGFFLLGLLFTLLCPKQSGFKTPGISVPAVTPLRKGSCLSDGCSGAHRANSEVWHHLTGLQSAGSYFPHLMHWSVCC